jgi:16S rRNA (guanine527-N7)-methyltransferase
MRGAEAAANPKTLLDRPFHVEHKYPSVQSSDLTPTTKRLPDGVYDKLSAYISMLGRWRRVTNLISDSSFANVWERHVTDCLQLIDICPSASRWLDIGTGAGFPGLVLAIYVAGRPDAEIHCVESNARKCAFLRDVVRSLQLPAIIHNERMEGLDLASLGSIDALTARAFGPLATILHLSQGLLETGATAVLPRGQSTTRELVGADLSRYTMERLSNATDKSGVILRIRIRV